MNTHPSVQDLEALLRGTLTEDQSIVVSAHTDECEACGRELSWLRAEHELFAQRARGVPPSQVWAQIEQQIAATAEFFDCGAAKAVSVAALLTIRGDMGAPESPKTIDSNLN